MNTLAIDIGGTKFSLALFAGEEMVLHESRSTDRQGGPRAMLQAIEAIVEQWRNEHKIDRCGIGGLRIDRRPCRSDHEGASDGEIMLDFHGISTRFKNQP